MSCTLKCVLPLASTGLRGVLHEPVQRQERHFAKAVSELIYCNPFLPERIEHERAALDGAFDDRDARWNLQTGNGQKPPNVVMLVRRVEELLERAALGSRLARPTLEQPPTPVSTKTC